jgi:hypothetical protein
VLGTDPTQPSVSYRYRLPPQAQRPNLRALFELMTTTDCYSPGDEISNLEPMLPSCPTDFHEVCDSFPNRERGCYGMCGPGCDECWDGICGDCCYHDFCAVHDSALRGCDGATDAVSCFFAAVPVNLLITGCDGGFLWW